MNILQVKLLIEARSDYQFPGNTRDVAEVNITPKGQAALDALIRNTSYDEDCQVLACSIAAILINDQETWDASAPVNGTFTLGTKLTDYEISVRLSRER